MKKFIITENEKRNILGMYSLINERSSAFQIPQEIFQIITDIEARFSYCSGGEVYGESSYKGDSKLGVFTNYVKNTIGFDTWNKLNNNTKAQIYSFAYQSDSGDGEFKYRWIKGLAQAIDSNFDRVNGDPKEAIKIIQSAKNLGAIYDDYKKVVKDQYNNITLKNDTDCNRKKVWGPRPDAVERMMGGENHNEVLDDWEKTYIKKVTKQTANIDIDSQTKKNKKIISYSNRNPNDLRTKLINFSQETELYNVNLSINKDDQNVIIEYDTQGDERTRLSYIFSNSGEENKVLEKVKEKNNVVDKLPLNFQGFSGWVIKITEK